MKAIIEAIEAIVFAVVIGIVMLFCVRFGARAEQGIGTSVEVVSNKHGIEITRTQDMNEVANAAASDVLQILDGIEAEIKSW